MGAPLQVAGGSSSSVHAQVNPTAHSESRIPWRHWTVHIRTGQEAHRVHRCQSHLALLNILCISVRETLDKITATQVTTVVFSTAANSCFRASLLTVKTAQR